MVTKNLAYSNPLNRTNLLYPQQNGNKKPTTQLNKTTNKVYNKK